VTESGVGKLEYKGYRKVKCFRACSATH